MSLPESAKRRYLVVNADDFGLSPGVNQGIIQSFESGIVRSASLMIRQPAASDAADYARSRYPEVGVGLHLDLGEWAYRSGEWVTLYEVVSLEDQAALDVEVDRQIDEFIRLMGHTPTHLDSHQNVHMYEPLRSIVRSAAAQLRVPLRRLTPGLQYCGDFYGQTREATPLPDALSSAALIDLLRQLAPGVTEFSCHPGLDRELSSAYRDERLLEVNSLCNPAVLSVVTALGITLCSFPTAPAIATRDH